MARKLKQARWSYAEDRRLLELAKSSKSPEEIARGSLQNGNPLRRPVKARGAEGEDQAVIARVYSGEIDRFFLAPAPF
jgi:hypothetical protein